MKKPLSISTKTGDAGTSGLANGERLNKNALIFEVLGTVDELNSWLGLAVSDLQQLVLEYPKLAQQRQFLLNVQDTLFFLGAELARSPKVNFPATALPSLEKKSDQLQQYLANGWTTNFILPGGAPAAAKVDIARTVCRRAERRLVSFSQEHQTRPVLAKYLNRLSDYLFILRCFVNQELNFEEKKFKSKFFSK
jgi:cob(I)alamin adenosyltransferase